MVARTQGLVLRTGAPARPCVLMFGDGGVNCERIDAQHRERGRQVHEVVYEDDGTFHTLKVPTTPEDPAIGVIEGMRHLGKSGNFNAEGLDVVLHATTVATNAIIERKGGRTALITTDGFRDVLIIGRQKRYETYDLYIKPPKPLVQRRDIFEVVERVAFDGETVIALNMDSLDTVIDRIAEANYDAVAVALLHAYAAPDHERQIRDRLYQRLPDIDVSISSEVSPKYREYERTSTAVIDAYIGPAVARYLARFGARTADVGIPVTPLIMQSNGGVVPLSTARRRAANMFVSGPAAAVTAAAEVAKLEGVQDVISIDIGGTSCDVCLITGGQPQTTVKGTSEFSVDGLPLNVVMTDNVTIGAGCGSIAR